MIEPRSKIPDGLQYRFGREARLRRSIEETAMSVFDGWSYEEFSTPTVDYYSLFERGMGAAEADRAFRFTDNDGRLLALRPDVTSGIARAAVTLLASHQRPLRLCYAAAAFRQQSASHLEWRREFVQIGCEFIGKNSIAADMEVLAIATEILRRLGLDYVITLNDAEIFNGVVEGLALDSESRVQLRHLVDTRNVADLESFLHPHASADDCRAFSQLIRLSGKWEILALARQVITNARSCAALDRLESLWRIIESVSLCNRFEIDLGDVSNLDYYTGVTFKIYVHGAGARVGSGGRYDELTGNFGKAEPAVGFVMDLEALSTLLTVKNGNHPKERTHDISADDTAKMFCEAVEQRQQNIRIAIRSDEDTR
jgi:ATP phosphoribosyltransferase regulatory subunit